jgi:hypothetical protein
MPPFSLPSSLPSIILLHFPLKLNMETRLTLLKNLLKAPSAESFNQNEKDLFQGRQTIIATGFIEPELDQNNIDPEKSKSRSELENNLCRGSLAWLGRQTHNLADNQNQMRNLEFARGKRPTTRSRGLESRPRHHSTLLLADLLEKISSDRPPLRFLHTIPIRIQICLLLLGFQRLC